MISWSLRSSLLAKNFAEFRLHKIEVFFFEKKSVHLYTHTYVHCLYREIYLICLFRWTMHSFIDDNVSLLLSVHHYKYTTYFEYRNHLFVALSLRLWTFLFLRLNRPPRNLYNKYFTSFFFFSQFFVYCILQILVTIKLYELLLSFHFNTFRPICLLLMQPF